MAINIAALAQLGLALASVFGGQKRMKKINELLEMSPELYQAWRSLNSKADEAADNVRAGLAPGVKPLANQEWIVLDMVCDLFGMTGREFKRVFKKRKKETRVR